MASRVWNDRDLEVLERHIESECWLDEVIGQFPNRTIDSIKTRMSKLRSQLGIKGRRGAREKDQDSMNADAVIASQQLLEATLRVGRWS